MKPIYIVDIETKADTAFFAEHGAAIFAEIEPAANIKDPAKIAANIADKQAAIVDKAALSPIYGRIVAVGLGALYSDDRPNVIASDDEKALLAEVCGFLNQTRPVLAGFFIRAFDLPFLEIRMAIHGLAWPLPRVRKYDDRHYADVVDIFEQHKLDHWLRAFGLPPKTGKGGDVATMTLDEVREYCADDVERERLLVRKLRHLLPALRDEGVLRASEEVSHD